MDDFLGCLAEMCDDCQINPAIVHLTHVEGGEALAYNLCEECARKRGIPIPDGDTLMRGLEELVQAAGASLGKTHLKVTVKPASEAREEREKEKVKERELEADVVCPNCGLKLSAFRTGGWLGCAECYDAFEGQIENILVQVHGSGLHKGKTYGRAGTARRGGKRDIERLRRDLDIAIKREEFELAATIRDAIRGQRQVVR